MSNVVEFTGITRLDVAPEGIIKRSLEASLTDVVVMGYHEDGTFYFASSVADGGTVLWLLETAKVKLLQCGQVIPTHEDLC